MAKLSSLMSSELLMVPLRACSSQGSCFGISWGLEAAVITLHTSDIVLKFRRRGQSHSLHRWSHTQLDLQ